MELMEVVRASVFATIVFSVIALPIACVSAFIFGYAFAPPIHRRRCMTAGVLGGLAGEFCAVCSLYLSLWISCNNAKKHGFYCNNAQAEVALVFLLPLGVVCGSLLASWWTRLTMRMPAESAWNSVFLYSGPSRIRNWCCAILVPMALCGSIMWLLAWLMA